MLSLGSVAYDGSGTELGTFSANLERLSDSIQDAKTMEWWERYPEAWESCRSDLRSAEQVMLDYCEWLEGLSGKPVFVAYPAGFDFTFVYWYLMKFVGRSPFGFSCLDIKTLAMAIMGTAFRGSTKRFMPPRWFGEQAHSHIAIEDAREQGELFFSMLKDLKSSAGES